MYIMFLDQNVEVPWEEDNRSKKLPSHMPKLPAYYRGIYSGYHGSQTLDPPKLKELSFISFGGLLDLIGSHNISSIPDANYKLQHVVLLFAIDTKGCNHTKK